MRSSTRTRDIAPWIPLLISGIVAAVLFVLVLTHCGAPAHAYPIDIRFAYLGQDVTSDSLWMRVTWVNSGRRLHPRQAEIAGYDVSVYLATDTVPYMDLLGASYIIAPASGLDLKVRYPPIDTLLTMYAVVLVKDVRGYFSETRQSEMTQLRIPPLPPWPVDSVTLDTVPVIEGGAVYFGEGDGDTIEISIECVYDSLGRCVAKYQLCLFYRDENGIPRWHELSARIPACEALFLNTFVPDSSLTQYVKAIQSE